MFFLPDFREDGHIEIKKHMLHVSENVFVVKNLDYVKNNKN